MKVLRDRFGEQLWCGETDVRAAECVWLECFWPHDYGKFNFHTRKVEQNGRCNTRERSGCPKERSVHACCDSPNFLSVKRHQSRKKCLNCNIFVPSWVALRLLGQTSGKNVYSEEF